MKLMRRAILLLGSALLLTALVSCGGKKDGTKGTETEKATGTSDVKGTPEETTDETMDETTDETTDETKGEDMTNDGSKAGGSEVEFSSGYDFVINLPAGYTYNSDWYVYQNKTNTVQFQVSDANMIAKEDTFNDWLVRLRDGKKKEKKFDIGGYTAYAFSGEDSAYNFVTMYFINFNGRYPDMYGCSMTVAAKNKVEDSLTPDILASLETIRKKGDPAEFSGKTQGDASASKAPETTKEARMPLMDLKIDYSREQTAEMANFMDFGQYLMDGDQIYGLAFNEGGDPCLVNFRLEKNGGSLEFRDQRIIAKSEAYYLTKKGKDIFFLTEQDGLCRLSADKTGYDVVIPEARDYFTIRGDYAYFTKEDFKYYRAKTDGSGIEKILDKEVYYVYPINDEWVIYQDDASGETLRLYHIPSGTDVLVSNLKCSKPIIAGHELFFIVNDGNHEKLARVDMQKVSITQNKEKKNYDVKYNVELGDKWVTADYSISYDGYIYPASEMGYALENWKLAAGKDGKTEALYKYTSADYDIYNTYEGDLVKSIEIVEKKGGSIVKMPRFK